MPPSPLIIGTSRVSRVAGCSTLGREKENQVKDSTERLHWGMLCTEKLEAGVSGEEIFITNCSLRGRRAEQVQVEHTGVSTLSAQSGLVLKCLWGLVRLPWGLWAAPCRASREVSTSLYTASSAQHVCPSSQSRADQREVPH